MRFTLVALTVGLMAGFLSGGRPHHMARRSLRSAPLLVAGVVIQLLAEWIGGTLTTALVLISYVVLMAYAARNIHIVGMALVLLGIAANAAVIGLNNGMPVRPNAVVSAGLAEPHELGRLEGDAKRRPERPGDKLMVLADIIPVPVLREVVSFGDLIIGVGMADVVVHLMRPPRRRRSEVAAEPTAVPALAP